MSGQAYDYDGSETSGMTGPGGSFGRSIDYDVGYLTALNDVLKRIKAEGKEGLVFWIENKVKTLP